MKRGQAQSNEAGDSPHLGFPRSARLLEAHQFNRVFQANGSAADDNWVVLASSRQPPQFNAESGESEARLGMAISRRRIRRAHGRNRIKRIARERFRQQRCQWSGTDFVVMVRGDCSNAPGAILSDGLARLFAKAYQRAQRKSAGRPRS